MNVNKEICPFCSNSADVFRSQDAKGFIFKDCLCGEFVIEEEVWEDKVYNKLLKTDKQKRLFSGYLRNHPRVCITNDFIGAELEKILEFCNTITLPDKIQRLEKFIYLKTSSLGNPVYIHGSLYTLFYLKDENELTSLVMYLEKAGFVSTIEGDSKNRWEIPVLTVEGFSRIEARLTEGRLSNKVFIACKFNTDYQKKLVETIQKACISYGFDANLVSGERHNDNISNKIIADIKKSNFMIADFTGQNNGVYFEAGYARGMRKEVIRLIRKGDIEELHFDTKQFNHIEWEDGKWKELMEALIDHIEVTIIDKKSEKSDKLSTLLSTVTF